MTRYVALLRAVNVGGRKLPMADLRTVLDRAGYAEARTYIQSGNIVFSAAESDAAGLEAELDALIQAEFGLAVDTVVVAQDTLAGVAAENPYALAAQTQPKSVHVVFTRGALDAAAVERVAGAEREARARGSSDAATVMGSVIYLHTPEGLGNSELAARLGRGGKKATVGTARNWRTVETLLAMCAEPPRVNYDIQ